MHYRIIEAAKSEEMVEAIHRFNGMNHAFPSLKPRHIMEGSWWFAYLDGEPVAFSGLVPFHPFDRVAYFKRCYVMPDHQGHGIQLRMMYMREQRARETGYTMIVSDCAANNIYSAYNFGRAGFEVFEPEQPWAEVPVHSIYWKKTI